MTINEVNALVGKRYTEAAKLPPKVPARPEPVYTRAEVERAKAFVSDPANFPPRPPEPEFATDPGEPCDLDKPDGPDPED